MKSFTESLILAVIVVLLASVSMRAQKPELSPSERGRTEAARDVQNEKFVIKTWGLLEFRINDIPTRNEVYEALLLRTYKVRFDWVAGCLIDEETLSYATAYNEVSKAGIEAKFGKDILETARKDADQEYESNGYAEKMREFDRKFNDALQRLPKKDN